MRELAWAAGFFDGEGSTTAIIREPTRKSWRGSATVRLRVPQVHREPLERFMAAVGAGKIRGPYSHPNPRAQPLLEYVVEGAPAEGVLELLWPYLCSIKRSQADRAREKVRRYHEEHPVRPRRNNHTRWHVQRGLTSPDCPWCPQRVPA